MTFAECAARLCAEAEGRARDFSAHADPDALPEEYGELSALVVEIAVGSTVEGLLPPAGGFYPAAAILRITCDERFAQIGWDDGDPDSVGWSASRNEDGEAVSSMRLDFRGDLLALVAWVESR